MAKTKPTIAITGASGFLGNALVEHFSAKKWQVIGLVRDPLKSSESNPRPNVTYEAYDISEPIDATLLRGVDYLVHAAYVKYDGAHPQALESNLAGAKNILRASRSNKVKRTIFISTMSAHEDAISVYGKQKLAIESLFNKPSETIIKAGLIMGNGGIVKQMADFMQSKHMVPLIAGGLQPLQIVAVSDLVHVIETIFQKDARGTYVIATPQVYTYKSFYDALARRLKVKVLYIPLPYWLLQSIFRTASALHLPLGVGEDNLKGLQKLQSMDSKKDLAKLGVSLMELDASLLSIEL
jgi:nucleoside-diphosphate-sugar epimerase